MHGNLLGEGELPAAGCGAGLRSKADATKTASISILFRDAA